MRETDHGTSQAVSARFFGAWRASCMRLEVSVGFRWSSFSGCVQSAADHCDSQPRRLTSLPVEPPNQGACPNRQPTLGRLARPPGQPRPRSAPPAGRHAQRTKPPEAAAARRTTCSPGSPPSPQLQQVRFGLDGPRCPIALRQPTADGGPVLGRCSTLPIPEAEAEAESKTRSRRGP